MTVFLALFFTMLVGLILLIFYQLTNKSKWITWTFLGLLIPIFIFWLYLFNWRQPSKDRVESLLGFSIEDDIEVLRDDYYDALRDYDLIYKIKLSDKAIRQIDNNLQQISTSSPNDSIVKSNWVKENQIYYYNKTQRRLYYNLKIDIRAKTIEYQETQS
jgi:type IV secretory pathway TrbL component